MLEADQNRVADKGRQLDQRCRGRQWAIGVLYGNTEGSFPETQLFASVLRKASETLRKVSLPQCTAVKKYEQVKQGLSNDSKDRENEGVGMEM